MNIKQSSTFFVIGNDIRQSYIAKELCKKGYTVYIYQGFESIFEPPTITQKTSLPNREIYYPKAFKEHWNYPPLYDGTLSTPCLTTPIPCSLKEGFFKSTYIIFPTIISSELEKKLTIFSYFNTSHTIIAGRLPDTWSDYCINHHISTFEYCNDRDFLSFNSKLTSEGLLSTIISTLPFSLYHRFVLLLGYGNCGMEIASLLKSFHCSITVVENNNTQAALAREHGFVCINNLNDFHQISSTPIIINTIPSHLFSLRQIQMIPTEGWIFDIASYPHGFLKQHIDFYSINYCLELGIPGKFSPITCGFLIVTIIEKNIIKWRNGDYYV